MLHKNSKILCPSKKLDVLIANGSADLQAHGNKMVKVDKPTRLIILGTERDF